MRIMTTSDLSYVSGGDSWGGTPEGQASSNPGCINGVSQSTYNNVTNGAAVVLMSPWEFAGPLGWTAAGGAAAAMLYSAYCGGGS